MFLYEMMRLSNYNNLSKDEMINICNVLRDEVKLLQSINSQKNDKDYNTINKMQNELNTKQKEIDNLSEKLKRNGITSKSLIKSLLKPLSFKERLSGKFRISKINEPDND